MRLHTQQVIARSCSQFQDTLWIGLNLHEQCIILNVFELFKLVQSDEAYQSKSGISRAGGPLKEGHVLHAGIGTQHLMVVLPLGRVLVVIQEADGERK